MPNIARRTIALTALAVAIIAAAVALDLPSAHAQSDDEQTGRIVARRLDDGRTEFGWQPSGGERVLPRLRYFPANVDHQRWLNSSPVEVGGEEIGRINVRLSEDGRIEFAFTPTDGERILPPSRYFPAAARPNRWLRSTELTIGPPAPATNPFAAVSAGETHSCGLREDGSIECWGSNAVGQADAPAGRFIAISTATDHNCALRESGEIECWGSNTHGESDPLDGRFRAVTVGSEHTCAIRESGEVTCWGNGLQLDAPAGSFSTVSAGEYHTCGLRSADGAIECWGVNHNHRQVIVSDVADQVMVDGVDVSPQPVPTLAPPGRFTAVSSGINHTCGLRESGQIECWGVNNYGERNAPAGRFTAVAAAITYACGLRDTGAIVCWGDLYPARTDAPAGRFSAVSIGWHHACGLRTNGAIVCWGDNSHGQTDAPAP